MRTGTPIWQLSALEIARAIREKEISCKEVIVSHFERIETVNPNINAITVTLYDSALDAAQKADQLLASEKNPPPLLGVPMTVKENIDCEGSATSFAVGALKDADPRRMLPM
jgi:amidase